MEEVFFKISSIARDKLFTVWLGATKIEEKCVILIEINRDEIFSF